MSLFEYHKVFKAGPKYRQTMSVGNGTLFQQNLLIIIKTKPSTHVQRTNKQTNKHIPDTTKHKRPSED